VPPGSFGKSPLRRPWNPGNAGIPGRVRSQGPGSIVDSPGSFVESAGSFVGLPGSFAPGVGSLVAECCARSDIEAVDVAPDATFAIIMLHLAHQPEADVADSATAGMKLLRNPQHPGPPGEANHGSWTTRAVPGRQAGR
jgi:hypothetical protein